MAGGKDNRTERPTQRRLQKAREKGQVARSKEVPAAFVLLGGLLVLSYSAQSLVGTLGVEMRDLLRLRVPSELSISYLNGLGRQIMTHMALATAPVMGAAIAISVLSNLVQGGGLTLSAHALAFRFEKLNPSNGLARVFSKHGTVQLIKSLFVLAIVSIISYQVISQHLTLFPAWS